MNGYVLAVYLKHEIIINCKEKTMRSGQRRVANALDLWHRKEYDWRRAIHYSGAAHGWKLCK